jgi:hypothetical protein
MSDPTKYIWRVRYKGDSEGNGWHEIDVEEVKNGIGKNYIHPDLLISAMMKGLVAQTSFAEYRATLRRASLDT